ncbi:hypothetical protein ATN84_24540 [Paramesorhizobium deserti]|uniref:Integrase n=2 Tax=Paramesorhizobium deserti TaxID=1494590 RepID=A0A135HXR1_9HYPH|nr:hypothetical protein ATN84_24540 [Paramesorhizobium deserti]
MCKELAVSPCLKNKEITMTINRYRYFYACAFSLFEGHLVAFVDEMVEHDHAESTVRIYLSCINDVAKAIRAAGIAACDLDETRPSNSSLPWDG